MRSRQEETQINVTLIEYLRQIFELKIPSLDPLPEDEHGTDIPLVFNTVRNCILDKSVGMLWIRLAWDSFRSVSL